MTIRSIPLLIIAIATGAAEPSAIAVLVPTVGNSLSGTVLFTPIAGFAAPPTSK